MDIPILSRASITSSADLLPKFLISSKSSSTMAVAKTVIRAALEVGLEEGIAIEADYFAKIFDTEDQEIGVQAFINRDTPKWKHR